jgi:outer membrane protein
MTFKHFVAVSIVGASALALASSASAQAPAAAAPAVPQGPVIPGVCIVSPEAVVGGSNVGKYVNTRLQQIVQQVQAELGGENTAIENEAKQLDSQRATLDANTFEQRGAALQVRNNALQRKAQLREREVQATEQKALARISQEMEPVITSVYAQQHCSVLLQRSAVVIGNPAMDITPAVVSGLNAKIQQFAFDRERLDQPQAAAAPRAAAPPVIQTPPARTPPKK